MISDTDNKTQKNQTHPQLEQISGLVERITFHSEESGFCVMRVTIHKSQGTEYPAVVIPIHTQHYTMLQLNLLYTAITRARKLVVLVGTQKAIAIAVKRVDSSRRVTLLEERLSKFCTF